MNFNQPHHKHLFITILGLIISVGFLFYVAFQVRVKQNTESQASRNTTLTPGDDVLSLQKDLEILGHDPGAVAEQELNKLK
jgi:hypothetical protein